MLPETDLFSKSEIRLLPASVIAISGLPFPVKSKSDNEDGPSPVV